MLQFSTAVIAVVLLAVAASAQPGQSRSPGQMFRIGYLGAVPTTPQLQYIWDAFVDGLRDYGWVQGRNIVIERRFGEGKPEREAEFAVELVRLRYDVIVVLGVSHALAVRRATAAIPIVTVAAPDPVGSGLVASLARPGGNITGMSSQAVDMAAKQLQLLKSAAPSITRVAVVWNPTAQAAVDSMKAADDAARRLHLEMVKLELRKTEDVDGVLATLAQQRVDALWLFGDPLAFTHRARFIDFANRHRLPAMYLSRDFAENGGLMAFGPSTAALFRAASGYVDRILRGARPAELPVGQPTKFDLVVNLKTAKAIGFTFPPEMLLRADAVIE